MRVHREQLFSCVLHALVVVALVAGSPPVVAQELSVPKQTDESGVLSMLGEFSEWVDCANVVAVYPTENEKGQPVIHILTRSGRIDEVRGRARLSLFRQGFEPDGVTVRKTKGFGALSCNQAEDECPSTPHRPARIGSTTQHYKGRLGTIGCRVTDGRGEVYALSNNHVFARSNTARPGDAILQPDPTLRRRPDIECDSIGTLLAFKKIDFQGKANNDMDAAIALSSVDCLDTKTPADGYGTPSSRHREVPVGAALPKDLMWRKVLKYGQASGQTSGVISGYPATVCVEYGADRARFVNQIIIDAAPEKEFCTEGDSGSLVVMEDGAVPVGLLFAKGARCLPDRCVEIGIASPIGPILEYFGVTVDGR